MNLCFTLYDYRTLVKYIFVKLNSCRIRNERELVSDNRLSEFEESVDSNDSSVKSDSILRRIVNYFRASKSRK